MEVRGSLSSKMACSLRQCRKKIIFPRYGEIFCVSIQKWAVNLHTRNGTPLNVAHYRWRPDGSSELKHPSNSADVEE